MIKRYQQSGQEGVTNAVDKLQQEVGAPLQLPTFPAWCYVLAGWRAQPHIPCSSTAVAATTLRTGETVSGSALVRRATVWFLTAAVRLWYLAAVAGTMPPTSIKWR